MRLDEPSKHHAVKISGPKGVGKSFALSVLWKEFHSSRPCILLSVQSLNSPLFINHLKKLLKVFGGELFLFINYNYLRALNHYPTLTMCKI